MSKSEPKSKLNIPTRTARPKGSMFQNLRTAEQVDSISIEELVSLPTDQAPTTQPPPTTHPIAPERNFSRVPNSIALSAIPSGIFRGESKKLYDALYQRTRGAIVPRRSIRTTQSELMQWASISLNTLKAHVRHLSSVGLLKVNYKRGESTGADYEVFTLEDRAPTTHQPTIRSPAINQNVGSPTHQNLVLGGGSHVSVDSTITGNPKTSFKTKEEGTDDEALPELRKAELELTGKSSSFRNWAELDKILATELRIAAARTTISNVPAFLTEHLRRRLFKATKEQMQESREAAQEEAASPSAKIDASKCPDCGGTGFYFPEGPEKGVARCKHANLNVPTTSTE